VALALAARGLRREGAIAKDPVLRQVAAVSVGGKGGVALLDLDYDEDSTAQVDMNVVATGELELVEVQGTAEGAAFRRQELDRMIDAALKGIAELEGHQARALQGG